MAVERYFDLSGLRWLVGLALLVMAGAELAYGVSSWQYLSLAGDIANLDEAAINVRWDAYQAFEILVQRGAQPAEGLIGWRKIIGLRNALVHDYLNIDPEIIRSVISQGYSDQLFTFAEQGLVWLSLQEEPKQGDQP